jgi:CubicO group peptidase (beta-lactamase class C family)
VEPGTQPVSYCFTVKALVPFLLLCSSIVHADPIDDFIQSEMKRSKAPAIEIGIVQNGKLIKHSVYGKSNLEQDVDAKVGDLYEIGSITKQFTAVATMLLVEEGKINLEDSVMKYLPDAAKAWEPIKIRNLLFQTSGLPDYAFEPGLGLTDEFDRAKFLGDMGKLPLDFAPGIAWSYSNTNYALMGWVIEKASGKSYMDFLRERVFTPVGMTRTTFSDPNRIIPGRSAGYLNVTGELIRTKYSSASINSDGTILSCVDDMLKWDAALRDRKLLKPSSYDLLWSRAQLNSGRWRPYGMGFNVPLPGGEPYYGHGGNSAGYSAGCACYPKAGISVVVLGNVYAFGGEPMAKQVAELVEPKLKATSPAAVKDPEPKRTDRVKAALSALGQGKADDTLMEPEVTAPMKTRRAAMSAPGLAPLKAIEKVEFAGEQSVGKDKLLTYKITTKTRDFVGTLLWSDGGKLAMASLRPDGPPKGS